MNELLSAILTFPTVLFTILLGVVVLYWAFVLLGTLDVDLLDGGDAEADVDGEPNGVAGVLQALGLSGVPLTLSLSLLILASWVLCILAMELIGGGPARWPGALAGIGALVLAVPLTALAVRPLRRFFVTHSAVGNRSLVGKICTITTLRVDERYGQAEVEDGGAGLLVQVRATGANGLKRGDRALLFDYKDEVFLVAPLDRAFQRSLADLG